MAVKCTLPGERSRFLRDKWAYLKLNFTFVKKRKKKISPHQPFTFLLFLNERTIKLLIYSAKLTNTKSRSSYFLVLMQNRRKYPH